MKLLSRKAIEALEQEGVASGCTMEGFMEEAGMAVFHELERRISPLSGKQGVILCGKGNNGGDGFVLARALHRAGVQVDVVLVQGGPATDLAKNAFLKLPSQVAVSREREIPPADFYVDAVFGFGFHGSLPGELQALLEQVNSLPGLKIACDLPSGTECDTGRVSPGAFRADVTVTFTGKKPGAASYPAREYWGETVVASVGIPPRLVEKAESSGFEPERSRIFKGLPVPGVQANKGNLGRLLMVCGSYGMAGACLMAARAALRMGVGLLELAVEESIYPLLAAAVPEAVFTPLPWEKNPEEARKRLGDSLSRSTACLLGCGLGELGEVCCPPVLEQGKIPLVVDADGLNALSRNPQWRASCSAPLVLTPHPGEMARLSGKTIPEINENRIETALEQAKRWNAVVALKGAGTVVAEPGGRYGVNPTGNPGMAKGGSGDVLAGMMASLAAQGMEPFEAAVSAVYLHGLAGDMWASRHCQRSLLPTDLIEEIPALFGNL